MRFPNLIGVDFQGLLYAHDCIAQKDYYPMLPEVPLDIDEEEETIKIVQLVKSNEPLVRSFYHNSLVKVRGTNAVVN